MHDLADRLRQVDRNPSPELWDEIEERARRPISRPPRRTRLVAGLVAAVIAAAAVLIAVRAFDMRTGEPQTVSAAPVLGPAPRECPVGLVNMGSPTWRRSRQRSTANCQRGCRQASDSSELTVAIGSPTECGPTRTAAKSNSTTLPSVVPRQDPPFLVVRRSVGPWRVTGNNPNGCGNEVLGQKARCLLYETSTPDAAILLNMMGLDRQEGDQVALSIDLEGSPAPAISNHVPARAVRLTATLVNSRFCNAGSIDEPTREAGTTFAEALSLLPGSSSLASYVGEFQPSTPAYDITYEGTCESGGRTLHAIEVLVLVPPGGVPVQIGAIGRHQGVPIPTEPFGKQLEACHQDWGCGDSPTPAP